MKRLLFYVVAILLSALLLAALPVSGEEGIYDSVIRLHVLAASDSREDQALKLLVRDEILTTYSATLQEAAGVLEAEQMVEALCSDIENTAQEVVKREGYPYTVKVEYSLEEYPTRVYDDYTFPAGEYRSLRVVIGEGEGANWWCVLFPPLCLDMAMGEKREDDALAVGLPKEEYAIITGGNEGYSVKFKALELLESVFGQRRK